MTSKAHSFAYLFERFPSFVQTFIYREAAEMVRQQMAPLLVSVRRPNDPTEVAAKLDLEVMYLPEEKELRGEVDTRRAARKVSWKVRRAIPRHRDEPDSQRMFEAIWLEPVLRAHGIKHIHAHFCGLAARTAWWLRKLFGFTYSFTGHANDIFCPTTFPISNSELAHRASLIVTETDYARRWVEDHYPFAVGNVRRVFNGLDPTDFFPREPDPGSPLILSVGRYVEKKGFDVLIEACAALWQSGQSLRCEIIGEGPLRAELQAQIERLGIGEHVHLAGPHSQIEIRRRLARAHLFVLACQVDAHGGSDNLPTVVAEAMMAGVPVVSTMIAGVPEMITNGKEGFLVPPRDVTALTSAMGKVLNVEPLSHRLMTAARQTAQERFAIENTTRELKRLLIQHVGIRPPPAALACDPTIPRRGWFG